MGNRRSKSHESPPPPPYEETPAAETKPPTRAEMTAAVVAQFPARDASFVQAFVDYHHGRFLEKLKAQPSFGKPHWFAAFDDIRERKDIVVGEHRAKLTRFLEHPHGFAWAVRRFRMAGLVVHRYTWDGRDGMCILPVGWHCVHKVDAPRDPPTNGELQTESRTERTESAPATV
jgi:hypothetical protein